MSEHDALTTAAIAWRLGGVFLLVFANGFFVAAEFALVGARRTRIEALARKGHARAKLADAAIHRLDHYISGTQLGITLASLGLGWVGERTLAAIFIQAFGALPGPYNVIASHVVAGAIAFALITFMHIVLGELAPKSLALLFPEQVSMWTAGPLIVFSRVLQPFIHLLNGTANLLLRAVGLKAPTEIEKIHRPEELQMLLDESYEHGLLREEPVEMIRSVFHMADTTAGDIMTPRTNVIAVPEGSTLNEVTDIIVSSGHSRLPVFRETLDNIVGIILARDVWRAHRAGQTDIHNLVRSVPYVPETKPVEQLLPEMQRNRIHLAVVIDEFGGTAGIVTIEDVIEEIVGEIHDEHEVVSDEIRTEGDHVIVGGSTSLVTLNDELGLTLPDDEFATVGGYVMGRLGRLANTGDEVNFAGGRMKVVAVSGRRVETVHVWVDTEPSGNGREP